MKKGEVFVFFGCAIVIFSFFLPWFSEQLPKKVEKIETFLEMKEYLGILSLSAGGRYELNEDGDKVLIFHGYDSGSGGWFMLGFAVLIIIANFFPSKNVLFEKGVFFQITFAVLGVSLSLFLVGKNLTSIIFLEGETGNIISVFEKAREKDFDDFEKYLKNIDKEIVKKREFKNEEMRDIALAKKEKYLRRGFISLGLLFITLSLIYAHKYIKFSIICIPIYFIFTVAILFFFFIYLPFIKIDIRYTGLIFSFLGFLICFRASYRRIVDFRKEEKKRKKE